MEKILNDAGEEIDVYTAEEVQQQKDEAVQAEADKRTELEAELTKLKEKDLNFETLRASKKAAEEKVTDAEKKAQEAMKSVDEKLEATKKEILEGVNVDHYKDTIKSLSGGDAEVEKKIEFHYKRLTDPASTKSEVTKKLTDAYYLATRTEAGGALNSAVISSGGAVRPTFQANKEKLSADEQALLQKLAQAGNMKLTDEDLK